MVVVYLPIVPVIIVLAVKLVPLSCPLTASTMMALKPGISLSSTATADLILAGSTVGVLSLVIGIVH